MLGRICTVALLAAAVYAQTDRTALVKAQRDREDQHWAQTSGLSVSDIQALRQIAGISDPAIGSRILVLDASTLKQRNHILFAEMGTGHCMRVHVIERNSTGFTEVWSLNEAPRPLWLPASRSGNGICSQAPKAPSAHATADGRIVVEVPILSDPFLRTLPVSTYWFTWNGAKYELVEDSDAGQAIVFWSLPCPPAMPKPVLGQAPNNDGMPGIAASRKRCMILCNDGGPSSPRQADCQSAAG